MTKLDARVRAEQPDPALPRSFYGQFGPPEASLYGDINDHEHVDVDVDEEQE